MTRRKAALIARPPITWILVADGRQAQVYTRRKIEKLMPLANNSRRNRFEEIIAHAPAPVFGMHWEAESEDIYDIERGQVGRVQESANSARHMAEPRLDVHEEIKHHFARTVAEKINKAQEKESFDRLVLVAPAKMMGVIKKHLKGKTLKKVVAELPKDLTHYDGEALAHHLEDIA